MLSEKSFRDYRDVATYGGVYVVPSLLVVASCRSKLNTPLL